MKRNRIKISRQEAVYRVALAGISAAVALLMVWLGVVVRFSTIAFFIAASVALGAAVAKVLSVFRFGLRRVRRAVVCGGGGRVFGDGLRGVFRAYGNHFGHNA